MSEQPSQSQSAKRLGFTVLILGLIGGLVFWSTREPEPTVGGVGGEQPSAEVPENLAEVGPPRLFQNQEVMALLGRQVEEIKGMEGDAMRPGVGISKVEEESLAAHSKLEPGDMIDSINGVRVSSVEQLYSDLVLSVPTQATTITGQRDSVPFRVTFPVVPSADGKAR